MEKSHSDFTGAIPEKYHRYLGPMLFQPFADDLARRVPVGPGVRVLEVACGTGIVSERLLRRLDGLGTLVATDLNEAMFAHAARRGVHGAHLTWRQADGTNLPFDDESFDAVVCQFGLMFFPDKTAGVCEAFRVLTRGGRYCFNVWDAIAHNPLPRIAHETLTEFFPDDPPRFHDTPFSLWDPAPIRRWLEDAGFVEIRVETVDKIGTGPTAAEAAIGVTEGNPVYVEIMNRRPGALSDIQAAIARKMRAELGDPVRAPMRAHVFTAQKP